MLRQDCLWKGFHQNQPFLSTVEILNLRVQDIPKLQGVLWSFKEQQMKGSQKSRKKNFLILFLKRLVIVCAHKGIWKYVVSHRRACCGRFCGWLALATILPISFQEKSGASSFMDGQEVVNGGQQPPLVTWCLHYLCISTQEKMECIMKSALTDSFGFTLQ